MMAVILRVKGFLQNRKKALAVVTVAIAAFFTADLGAASAFRQPMEINGASVETDKQVYMIEETVKTSIFFVNQMDSPTDVCINL